jgi:PAS domain S-box-containing protein
MSPGTSESVSSEHVTARIPGPELDETELRILEAALRQREHELQEAYRIARLGTWHWVCETDTVTWSDEVYRTFRCDPNLPPPGYEEIQQLHAPESRVRLYEAVERALRDGTPYELDMELHWPGGESTWITSRGEVDRWVSGKVWSLRGTIQEITERKRNEQRLAWSESRYRSLVNVASEIVWITNPQGATEEDVPAWRAFTGQTIEELRGFGWSDAIHPDDRETTMRAWTRATSTGETFHVEHRLRRHDGVYRIMNVRGVPARNAAGEIIEWVGMHTDVTEQRMAERALRQSESVFRKLSDADLIGICFPDRFGAFSNGNDKFLRIVGYTREELEQGLVRWDTMTPPEYAALDAERIAEAARRGSCTPYEKEYLRKDGTRVPLLVGYALLEGSSDEYIGFILDLTEQKRAQAEIQEREQRFRNLAESLPMVVWVHEVGGSAYFNRWTCEYVGRRSEDLGGGRWLEVIHPDERAISISRWTHSLETGEPYLNEYRLRRHDGEYRHFMAQATPVRNHEGKIDRWLGTATDIHDRKLAEEALRRSEKLAVTGRLAASIAHEINNPLAAVTNTLYLALQDRTLSDATRDYLRTAEDELARVAQVATQTLRFHRQSSAPADVDLAELMDSAFSIFAARFKSCAVAVQREYEGHTMLHCCGDEVRQIFANLLSNALDATPHSGRVRLRIHGARNTAGERGLQVLVADTGAGIPAHLMRRVFEPFLSTKESTGTGLGLWIAHGIVAKHRGQIKLRSRTRQPGSGTVVSIFLPFDGLR